jgi:hypothetical protein
MLKAGDTKMVNSSRSYSSSQEKQIIKNSQPGRSANRAPILTNQGHDYAIFAVQTPRHIARNQSSTNSNANIRFFLNTSS